MKFGQLEMKLEADNGQTAQPESFDVQDCYCEDCARHRAYDPSRRWGAGGNRSECKVKLEDEFNGSKPTRPACFDSHCYCEACMNYMTYTPGLGMWVPSKNRDDCKECSKRWLECEACNHSDWRDKKEVLEIEEKVIKEGAPQ